MKHPNIIFLLYCIEIMVGQFVHVQSLPPASEMTTALTPEQTTPDHLTANTTFLLELTTTNSLIIDKQTPASQTPVKDVTSPPPPPPPRTPSTTWNSRIFKKECFLLLVVAGGLIIACAILLISTFFLACKVCQLSRRIKMLSSDCDLMGNAEYWVGTAKKNQNKSEPDAKETTVLMSDLGQTHEEVEVGDGGKDETGKQDQHKDKGVCENGGEVGDAAKTEGSTKETPATIAENPSTSKPPEEVGDSRSTSAEGQQEAKDAA